MKTIRILLLSATLLSATALHAVETPDPTLLLGLKAFETNGLDAATAAWYPDQPALAAEMRNKLLEVTKTWARRSTPRSSPSSPCPNV